MRKRLISWYLPPAACILLTLLLATPTSSQARDSSSNDPWAILGQLRTHLSLGPVEVDFVQTFLPMGFTSGDQEQGTMALMLPDCIRWDYLDPFPKVFLLCDEIAYAWNPGEKTGRRVQTAEQDQASLDLIRLSPERLEQDYSATLDRSSEDRIAIELVPKLENVRIKSARLVTSVALDRLIELRFSDADGNLTIFEMTNHRKLEDTARLSAPSELTWLEN